MTIDVQYGVVIIPLTAESEQDKTQLEADANKAHTLLATKIAEGFVIQMSHIVIIAGQQKVYVFLTKVSK